jgi:2-polyprenyl-6-methoxyphenol hydroxylase-like FAD-dependent oxidoreductase
MQKHTLHVSIIGGGIGGLAAASALRRQGIGVTVFDRNPELREIGAGLTLWANWMRVLRHLGLADALMTVSARFTHFECWSWRGKRLGSMRLDTLERRVGAPSLGIHRVCWQGWLIRGASTCMRTASASGQSKSISSLTSPMGTNSRRMCWSARMGCIR